VARLDMKPYHLSDQSFGLSSKAVPPTGQHLCSDGNLNLDTSLNVDDDLLDNLSWGVETVEVWLAYAPVIILFQKSSTLSRRRFPLLFPFP
jgi:hypothetical protein